MLRTRVITALVLLFGLLAVLFLLPPAAWLGFCALVCFAGAWEWGALAGFRTPLRLAFSVGAAVLCFVIGHFAGLTGQGTDPALLLPAYSLSVLFWLLLVPIWLKSKWRLSSPILAMLVGVLVLVPPALALAHLRQFGPWLLLAAMAVVWVADIAAYFSGRAFGRHKLAPAISPGKTWEGAYGAAAGVLLFGYIVAFSVGGAAQPAGNLLLLAPILVLVTAVSIIGDLFESLLKRQAGMKDSGTLLPGHGGVLDRIDSLTSTLPLIGLGTLLLIA
ncbi:phosphatidate cytidylyltransferase [Azoarcus indigens]|uniref:Phosphatidate cytidylyltransferase n=1 Tax=Azoarcus indigens TaxID=29545 RepID=A0A4V3BL77_9RHOO|nr:phosphatidate cytidylyltransferase [Azoarcus indigens]NMG67437.1 phosphatidate cytidylyltransferase [Azoarcus indigens]TDN45532.1 phosphatidate cytidylyltransferase [Azoarcus indigens]